MANFGVTASGFVAKQQQDIISDIQTNLQASLGQNLNFIPQSLLSQFINTFAAELALAWQGIEGVRAGWYPNTAEGTSLDDVGSISGVPRLGALPSIAPAVRLFGTPGTTVPAGTLFSVSGNATSIFATNSTVTLGTSQDEIQHIAFGTVPTAGQWQLTFNGQVSATFNYNDAAATVQAAIRALLFGSGAIVTGNYTAGFSVDFAGVSGNQPWPVMTVSLNTLVTVSTPVVVTVSETQLGVVAGLVDCTCTQTGPVVAPAGTLTVINTPITGLTAVLNVTDAVVGRNVETDTAYRVRRAQSLQSAGAGTFEAIRSKLGEISGVTAVVMFENINDVPDVAGRPPHSFEAVVQGGANQNIIDELWQVKPAGIASISTATGGSNITGTAIDSMGQPHTLSFSRPTQLLIYVEVDLTTDLNYPVNGDAAVAQAIVTAGNALGIGKEVIVVPYLMASLAAIQGIQTAVIKIGLTPGPTSSSNIVVASNQIAVFDESRITVVP